MPNTIKVTDNERNVLDCLAMNCYGDQNYGRPFEDKYENYGATWVNSILERDLVKAKSLPGIVASLSKKGLVHSDGEAVGLTELGFEVWLREFPPAPTPDGCCPECGGFLGDHGCVTVGCDGVPAPTPTVEETIAPLVDALGASLERDKARQMSGEDKILNLLMSRSTSELERADIQRLSTVGEEACYRILRKLVADGRISQRMVTGRDANGRPFRKALYGVPQTRSISVGA